MCLKFVLRLFLSNYLLKIYLGQILVSDVFLTRYSSGIYLIPSSVFIPKNRISSERKMAGQTDSNLAKKKSFSRGPTGTRPYILHRVLPLYVYFRS